MERGNRTWTWAVLLAASLYLSAGGAGFAHAESCRACSRDLDSGKAKSVRLSLKISGAKKRKGQVSFYKSVARQTKIPASGGRSLSSGR